MSDLASSSPAPLALDPNSGPTPLQGGHASGKVLAVTSGKGGVGKTFFSANLACALARRGQRVLVIDADLGLANLDVVLNLFPKVTLHDVFAGKSRLEDAIVTAPGGFSAILAGSGLVEYSHLTADMRDEFSRIVTELKRQFDVILLDMNFNSSINTGNEGIFWLKKIKNIDEDMVVMMITAYGDAENYNQAMTLGADDFLTKPVASGDLFRAIENAFARHQTLRDLKDKLDSVRASAATSRRSLAGVSTIPRSTPRTRRSAAITSAPPSTRRSRGQRPTSSAAP